jgi:hypothetical protein
VIDQDARILGEVSDLAITGEGEVGISVKPEEGDEIMMKLDRIKKIADVILLKAEGYLKKADEAPTPSEPELISQQGADICSNCNFENLPGTKFCVKCGEKLG